MEMKEMNLLGIIGIIGAIILVVGVFLTWLSITAFGVTETVSGWDVYKDGGDPVKYCFTPLLALICGIIAIVLMIVPTFMNVDKFKQINNILGIVVLILSILVVVFAILFWTQSIDMGLGVTMKLTDMYDMGIGFWLVLIGGIITMIGGLMPIIKDKLL